MSRYLFTLLGALLAVASAASHQPVDELVLYQPPLRAPIADHFRPPAHVGGSGNRGVQYGSANGQGVRAAAPGVVSFAGSVATRKVVSIVHADGLKTTYTGLRDIWVRTGERVELTTPLGVSLEFLHFGALVGDHYVDPQVLFDASEVSLRARLVVPPD